MSGGQQMTAILRMSSVGGGSEPEGIPYNSILREPTESMPNGVPFDSMLVFKRVLSECVFASTSQLRGGKFMTAEDLGMQQGMAGNFGTGVEFDTFKLGEIAYILLSIDLGETGRRRANFQDGRLVAGAPNMSFGELPEWFRERVVEVRKRMSQNAGFNIGHRRRQIPPVP